MELCKKNSFILVIAPWRLYKTTERRRNIHKGYGKDNSVVHTLQCKAKSVCASLSIVEIEFDERNKHGI
jgi:hypothetical protein